MAAGKSLETVTVKEATNAFEILQEIRTNINRTLSMSSDLGEFIEGITDIRKSVSYEDVQENWLNMIMGEIAQKMNDILSQLQEFEDARGSTRYQLKKIMKVILCEAAQSILEKYDIKKSKQQKLIEKLTNDLDIDPLSLCLAMAFGVGTDTDFRK